MTTTPPARETTSPHERQNLCVMAVLFGTGVVFLAQGFLWRVVWRAQQSLLPPGADSRVLAMSTLTLPAVQTVVCTLFLIPWALLGDRFGPRLSCTGGMLLWGLGALAGSWSGSTGLLLVTYALQAAGAAAVIPAALATISAVQQQRGGLLAGLIIALPALLYLPGSLIADLLAQSLDWRTSLVLVAVVAIPPLLLGWFTLPPVPVEPGPDEVTARRPGKRRAVVQTLLLGAVLAGIRIHLELAFASHHGSLATNDAAGYARAHSGLIDFPFVAGLAVGLVVGTVARRRRDDTWVAWSVAGIGVAVTSIPLLPFDIATPAGAVLASLGLGFGLAGRLVTLLHLAAENRVSRAGALFLAFQNLGYGVGVGLPMALALTVGVTIPEARIHLFWGCSLILLATGLVLAIASKKRATPGTGGP